MLGIGSSQWAVHGAAAAVPAKTRRSTGLSTSSQSHHHRGHCSFRVRSSFPSISMDNPRKPISHVIFNMDGLLLDTEKFYGEAQEAILARYNKTMDWDLKSRVLGWKGIHAARRCVKEVGISELLSAEQFLVEIEEMLVKDLFPTSELMPGASRLLKHLHAKGVPFCLTTSSERPHFELKTQRHRDLFSLMHHVVFDDDPQVKQGVISADIFLVAVKRFEGGPVNSGNILVFEDSPLGVLTAKLAGMSTVLVPDPRLDTSGLKFVDQMLNSLLDFIPSEWGLPPFEDN